jgi:hypothetical protein
MGQAQEQLAIIAQGIQAHDPGLRSPVNAAFIAHDKKLFLRLKSFDPGETAGHFRGLEWQEDQFQKGRLAGEPRSASPAQRALSIE